MSERITYHGISMNDFHVLEPWRRRVEREAGVHYPELRGIWLPTVNDVKAMVTDRRRALGLTRERFAQVAGVSLGVVEDLEVRGVSDFADTRRVFALLGVKATGLPPEFARYDLERES